MEKNDVIFCTLTNHGYIKYTLNCLKSLENVGIKDKLHVYCSDKSSFEEIKTNHENTFYFKQDIIDENDKRLFKFTEKQFQETMILKMNVIHTCLQKAKYVLFTDGDIVYYRNGFIEYLLENLKDDNILIQNDKMEGCVSMGDKKPVCCAGFIFIKQTPVTLELFNFNTKDPFYKKHIESSNRHGNFDDQLYLRSLKNNHNDIIKMRLLPSYLFPSYFVVKSKKIPKNWDEKYLLHFNYLIGNTKMPTMKNHKSWFI